MPEINSFSGIVWLVVILAQPLLAFLLTRTGARRRWGSLFVFVCANAVWSFALAILYLAGQRFGYFFAFWIGAIVINALQIWILIEVTSALTGISPRFRRYIRFGVPMLSAGFLLISSIIAWQVQVPFYAKLLRVASGFDRSVSLAWALSFLAISVVMSAIGQKWDREVLGVACGFAVQSVSDVLSAWAFSLFGQPWAQLISNAKSLVFLFALGLWAATFLQKVPSESPTSYRKLRELVFARMGSISGTTAKTGRTNDDLLAGSIGSCPANELGSYTEETQVS